jgi:hypothetical protein
VVAGQVHDLLLAQGLHQPAVLTIEIRPYEEKNERGWLICLLP